MKIVSGKATFAQKQMLVVTVELQYQFTRELKQTTTATGMNKRFNEQNNGCACAL